MKLSAKAKFAVTAMISMALREAEGTLPLIELSRELGISVSYLEQLFARLRRAGLVRGRRGHGGGYVFCRPISRISIADVVVAIDGHAAQTKDSVGHRTDQILAKLNTKFYAFLGSITLDSLVREADEGTGYLAGGRELHYQAVAPAR
jgi:Rrf2 family iron-sulfur cluster assembly transcriptional regulator